MKTDNSFGLAQPTCSVQLRPTAGEANFAQDPTCQFQTVLDSSPLPYNQTLPSQLQGAEDFYLPVTPTSLPRCERCSPNCSPPAQSAYLLPEPERSLEIQRLVTAAGTTATTATAVTGRDRRFPPPENKQYITRDTTAPAAGSRESDSVKQNAKQLAPLLLSLCKRY